MMVPQRHSKLRMNRDRLLQAACVGAIFTGAAMLLLPAPTRAALGWLLLGDAAAMDTWPAAARGHATLLHGVLGAVMVGWGVGLLLAWRGVRAWTVVAASVGCWLVPDCLYTLAVGAWPNLLLNAAFGLTFALALWLARPSAP
jgi:hypothetical protein